MKNQKGITLIALVITIIVLLILAGISIAMLAGDNGVLTKASDSKIVNALGAAKDEINLKAAEALSDYYDDIYLTNNSTTYQDSGLVTKIMTKLATEFTAGNTTGTEKDYTDYTIAISGTTANSTITVKSKAKPSLQTQGKILAKGGIEWTDTFKATTTNP